MQSGEMVNSSSANFESPVSGTCRVQMLGHCRPSLAHGKRNRQSSALVIQPTLTNQGLHSFRNQVTDDDDANKEMVAVKTSLLLMLLPQ